MILVTQNGLFEIAAALATARRRVADARDRVTAQAGMRILNFAQEDYRIKAAGGSGRDGMSWPALKPNTIRRKRVLAESLGEGLDGFAFEAVEIDPESIGFRSGATYRSLFPGELGNVFEWAPGASRVEVGFNLQHSILFDQSRPVLPDDDAMPLTYLDPIEDHSVSLLEQEIWDSLEGLD